MTPPKIKYVNRQYRTVAKHLRSLPGELVTHDAHDPERVHKHDPAHVRKPLIREAAKRLANNVPPITRAQAAVRALFDKLQEDPFRFQHLDQEVVDLWRARTILAWAKKNIIPTDTYHLWFDRADGHSCTLKDGPPPPRGDRPKHLKNLNLELHVLDWSRRMRDIVKCIGIDPEDALEEVRGKVEAQKVREAAAKAASH